MTNQLLKKVSFILIVYVLFAMLACKDKTEDDVSSEDLIATWILDDAESLTFTKDSFYHAYLCGDDLPCFEGATDREIGTWSLSNNAVTLVLKRREYFGSNDQWTSKNADPEDVADNTFKLGVKVNNNYLTITYVDGDSEQWIKKK